MYPSIVDVPDTRTLTTLTLPTNTDTLVGRTTIDTLTNKTLFSTTTWNLRIPVNYSVGTNNTFSESADKCVAVGNDNSIPANAKNCIIIGNNITLTEVYQLHNAIYIGSDSKILISINGEFVDIAEKLADLEEKVNMLLYAPGGPMYQIAKQSFDEKKNLFPDVTRANIVQ